MSILDLLDRAIDIQIQNTDKMPEQLKVTREAYDNLKLESLQSCCFTLASGGKPEYRGIPIIIAEDGVIT